VHPNFEAAVPRGESNRKEGERDVPNLQHAGNNGVRLGRRHLGVFSSGGYSLISGALFECQGDRQLP